MKRDPASIHKPRQSRSQKTLERLLDAAEEIFAGKSFEETSVQEIAAKAGFTIGAFYARFNSKDAILLALAERVRSRMAAFFDELSTHTAKPLPERIRILVDIAVAFYEQNHAFLALLRRRARSSEDWQARTRELNREVRQRLCVYLDPDDAAIHHPAPTAAVDVALLMLFSTLREMMVHGTFWPADLDRQRLADELAHALHLYLSTRTDRPVNPDSHSPEAS